MSDIPLYSRLGLVDLYYLLRRFHALVKLCELDPTMFEAEIQRITEEIKILGEKADYWDRMNSVDHTLTAWDMDRREDRLNVRRKRIMASFKSIFARQKIEYDNQRANSVPNSRLGAGNDLIYSSASSDSSTRSNEENVFRPINVPLQQQPQPGPSSAYSSSSSSTSSASSKGNWNKQFYGS